MRALLTLLLLFSLHGLAQQKKSATQPTPAVQKDKYHDNIDDRMKGPNGEKIYIGEKGGRYYLKNGKKIYVAYKGNSKKPS